MSDEIILKIILLGDSNSGKTIILKKYCDFDYYNLSLVGFSEFKSKLIRLKNININLQIWDTLGQERFKGLTKSFTRNIHGIMFVYDITDKNSFNLIKNFYIDTKDQNIKSIIVGTNVDLEDKRQVHKENVEIFCEKNNIKGFEVSLKSRIDDVSICFESLVNLIIENKSKEELLKLYGNKNGKLELKKKDSIKFKSEKVSLNNDEIIFFPKLKKYLNF